MTRRRSYVAIDLPEVPDGTTRRLLTTAAVSTGIGMMADPSDVLAQGPLAARPHDYIAIGYVRDPINTRVINQENALLLARGVPNPGLERGENIVELAYGLQVTRWMQLHPNVQYIGNPGAFSFKHVPDAWVFGTHVGLTF